MATAAFLAVAGLGSFVMPAVRAVLPHGPVNTSWTYRPPWKRRQLERERMLRRHTKARA